MNSNLFIHPDGRARLGLFLKAGGKKHPINKQPKKEIHTILGEVSGTRKYFQKIVHSEILGGFCLNGIVSKAPKLIPFLK
jgi:hypothetical protein